VVLSIAVARVQSFARVSKFAFTVTLIIATG